MRYYLIGTVAALIFSAVGIYLGVINTNGALKTEYIPALYTLGGFLLSIVAMIVADRFSNAEHQKAMIEKMKSTIAAMMPADGSVRRLENADEAADHIAALLTGARECWNTRISPAGSDISQQRRSKFEGAIVKALSRGMIYRDILSTNHIPYAERMLQHGRKTRGSYSYAAVTASFPVINFIIIRGKDNEYDVFFGWPVGGKSGAERSVFASRDRRVVDYFLDYFSILKEHAPPPQTSEATRNDGIAADV